MGEEKESEERESEGKTELQEARRKRGEDASRCQHQSAATTKRAQLVPNGAGVRTGASARALRPRGERKKCPRRACPRTVQDAVKGALGGLGHEIRKAHVVRDAEV